MARALVSARSAAGVSAAPALDLTAAAITCLLVWIAFLPYAALDIDAFHDGLMLKPALDVVAGQTLFRDSLMMYGPLSTGLQATALALFGETLLVLRMSTIFAYGLVAGLLMLCWRLVLPRPLAIISGALWVLFSPLVFATHPWPSVYALVFQSAALLALMRALSVPGGRGWALTSGVMAALTLLARQFPTGFFTCAGVIAALVLVAVLFPTYRRRAVEAMVGAGVGMLVVLALFFVHLVWQGSLDQWWLQTVVWAFEWSQTSGGSGLLALQCLDMYWRDGLLFGAVAVPLLFMVGDRRSVVVGLTFALAGAAALLAWRFGWIESLGQGITAIAFVLTFAATAYVAWRDRHAPRLETVMTLVAMVICLGSWTQAYPLGDPGHLFWGLCPSYGFSVLAAWQLGRRRTALVAALLVVLWSPFVVHKARQFTDRLNAPRVTLTEPPLLAGMRELPRRAARWTRFAEAMRRYSRNRSQWAMLLEGHDMVALSLAPDRTNSDPYFVRFQHLPYDDAERARFILRARPLILREQPEGELVREAMEQVGYVQLTKWQGSELLAPRTAGAGDVHDKADVVDRAH